MYTANVVDTVVFRSLGKQSSRHHRRLKRAVDAAETELWVPATVYDELADFGVEPPVNPYLDDGIDEGWIRLGKPMPGDRRDDIEAVDNPVERARHLADEFISQNSKYPTTNNWRDSALVALVVHLFETNTRIRVITHTADELLAKACAVVPPEFGYYEITSRYYNPPGTAKRAFPVVDSLTWDGQ